MMRAAATPFPATSASAMAGQIEEVVIVASHTARGNAYRRQRGDRRIERLPRQQALLYLRRQCEIALQPLMLHNPAGQTRILQHEGELVGAIAQQPFPLPVVFAISRSTQQEHSEHFFVGAEWRG